MTNNDHALRILARAAELTGNENQGGYGPVKQNLQRIADLWTTYLDCGVTLRPESVAWMIVLIRIAESEADDCHENTYIDAAAYAAIAGECRIDD